MKQSRSRPRVGFACSRLPARLWAARLLIVFLALGASAGAWAAKADLDYERLRNSLGQLKADGTLGPLAPSEIALADQALAVLALQSDRGKEHDHLVYVAERRIDIAYAAAQAVEQERKLQRLDREHDRILLVASRRDAEQARLELEKQRIQSLAQTEEADRLRAEADAARAQNEQSTQQADTARKQAAQARKLADAQAKEAELARKEAQLLEASGASTGAKGSASKPAAVESIAIGDAFAAGQAVLKTTAQPQIRAHRGGGRHRQAGARGGTRRQRRARPTTRACGARRARRGRHPGEARFRPRVPSRRARPRSRSSRRSANAERPQRGRIARVAVARGSR